MVMGWIWTGMVLLALGSAVLTWQTGADWKNPMSKAV